MECKPPNRRNTWQVENLTYWKVGSKYKAKKLKYRKSPKFYVRIPPAASQMVCVLPFHLKSCETTIT